MNNFLTSIFLIVAIMSIFWAYTLIDSLIKEFSENITYIDLIIIFILGLTTGTTIVLAFILRRKSIFR